MLFWSIVLFSLDDSYIKYLKSRTNPRHAMELHSRQCATLQALPSSSSPGGLGRGEETSAEMAPLAHIAGVDTLVYI